MPLFPNPPCKGQGRAQGGFFYNESIQVNEKHSNAETESLQASERRPAKCGLTVGFSSLVRYTRAF
jgi:hypothetical protein